MRLRIFHGEVPEAIVIEIVDIYIACFTGPPRFEKWTVEEVTAHVGKFIAGGADCFIIEEEDGTISAFAIGIPMASYFNKEELESQGASKSSYYFAELGTRPEARGNGYGSALHDAREAEARRKNFKLLNVRVRADNDINIKLLTRKGFKQVGEYTGSIKGSESSRLVLAKVLD